MLLIAEIKIVSHGVLAIGGIIAMALGSLMLFDAPEMASGCRGRVILPTVGATAGLFLFVVSAGAARADVALAGDRQTGAGRADRASPAAALSPEGQVLVHGELWQAVARGAPVEEGARVRVVDVNGLTLTVEKAGEGGACMIPIEWLLTLVVIVVAVCSSWARSSASSPSTSG